MAGATVASREVADVVCTAPSLHILIFQMGEMLSRYPVDGVVRVSPVISQ